MRDKIINEIPIKELNDREKYELEIVNDVIINYNITISTSNVNSYMVYKLWAILAAAAKVAKEESFSNKNIEVINTIVFEFEGICKARKLKY